MSILVLLNSMVLTVLLVFSIFLSCFPGNFLQKITFLVVGLFLLHMFSSQYVHYMKPNMGIIILL